MEGKVTVLINFKWPITETQFLYYELTFWKSLSEYMLNPIEMHWEMDT